MNTELLLKVRDAILHHPDQFVMDAFFSDHNCELLKAGGCGTAGCIIGWAYCLATGAETLGMAADQNGKTRNQCSVKMLDILGISWSAFDRLSCLDSWPADLLIEYDHAPTAGMKAGVAVRRIDRFIQTQGAE